MLLRPINTFISKLTAKVSLTTYCLHNPVLVQLEITNRCNLNCLTCYRRKLSDYGDIEWADFKEIVNSLWGVKVIHLFGAGEPLLHSKLAEMISYCRFTRKIPYVGITTNGMLLSNEISVKIVSAGLSELRVSLDAGDDKTLSEIRRGANLSTIVNNVANFSKIFETSVGINTVITDANLESLLKLPEIAKEMGAKIIRFRSMKPFGTSKISEKEHMFEQLPKFEKQSFLKELSQRCDRFNIRYTISVGYYKKCIAPFKEAYIDFKGNMTPCCTICDIFVGNVLESNFRAVWNGKEMRLWRKILSSGSFPPKCREICRVEVG